MSESAMIEIPPRNPGDTVVLTLRHGLTELNRDKRIGGQHLDVPLLPEGVRQAEEARARFAGTTVDVVIASPLARAMETAEIVTGWSRAAMVIDGLCTERSFGRLEGLTRAQVEAQFPDVRYLRIGHLGYSLNPPDGEPFPALQSRAREFLGRVLDRYRGRRVLVSSHQNFLQQLHGVLHGMDPYEALRSDILNLELNLFLLDPHGNPRVARVVHLVPSAAQYPSF
jgi:broad specificity phosphatase PhoE